MQRLINIGVSITLCIIAIGIGLVVARTFGSGGPAPSNYVTPGPTQPNQDLAQVGTPRTATVPPSATLATTAAPPKPTATPAEPTNVRPTTTTLSRTPTRTPKGSPTATAAPTNAAYIEYTIQKGDILYTIAREHNVTIEEILAINQIANPASLTVGEVIRIPRK